MWWQILGNAFAPMLQGSFDLVVGNPPGCHGRRSQRATRRSNDSQWLDYGLRPDVPLIAAKLRHKYVSIFRCCSSRERWTGCCAMVAVSDPLLPPTCLNRSFLAGRGFRRRRLPNGTYRLCHIEDLSRLFWIRQRSESDRSLIASKEEGESYPVPVVEWSKATGNRELFALTGTPTGGARPHSPEPAQMNLSCPRDDASPSSPYTE